MTFGSHMANPDACPNGPHRGPQGPNEDLSQCSLCLRPSFALRPEGETFGVHLADCSLTPRHLGYCRPGGAGHPRAPVIRGWYDPDIDGPPTDETVRREVDARLHQHPDGRWCGDIHNEAKEAQA